MSATHIAYRPRLAALAGVQRAAIGAVVDAIAARAGAQVRA